MGVMGQGLVLMVAGMTIVYLFLWLLIVVVKHSNRFVIKFDYLVPDEPKPKRKAAQASVASSGAGLPASAKATADAPAGGAEVKAPVPGTVLRLSASNGQQVHKGDELLVMDVMKMETPISAPCDGMVTITVAATDKVATGGVVAVIA